MDEEEGIVNVIGWKRKPENHSIQKEWLSSGFLVCLSIFLSYINIYLSIYSSTYSVCL